MRLLVVMAFVLVLVDAQGDVDPGNDSYKQTSDGNEQVDCFHRMILSNDPF